MTKKAYTEDVLRLARANENFRQVLYTTERSQIVLMSLKPGEEIGEEVHEDVDQVLAFADGVGEAVIEGERSPVRNGTVVVVPGGTRHNFINTGGAPLKLVTVYTPPEHPDGTVHRTEEDSVIGCAGDLDLIANKLSFVLGPTCLRILFQAV